MTEDDATYSVLIVSADQVPGEHDGAVTALRGEFKLSQESAEHVVSSIPAVVKRRASRAAAQSMVAALKGHGFEVRMVRSGGTGTHRAVSVTGAMRAVDEAGAGADGGEVRSPWEKAEPTWKHTGDHAAVRRVRRNSGDAPEVTRFGPPLRRPTGDRLAVGDSPTVRRFDDDDDAPARDALLMTGSPPAVPERPPLRPPTPETVPPVDFDDGNAEAEPWSPGPPKNEDEARRRRILATPELGSRAATWVSDEGWSRAGEPPGATAPPEASFAVPESLLGEEDRRAAAASERIDRITDDLPPAGAEMSDVPFPSDSASDWLERATGASDAVAPQASSDAASDAAIFPGSPAAHAPPVDDAEGAGDDAERSEAEAARARVQDELDALGEDSGPMFGGALDLSGGLDLVAGGDDLASDSDDATRGFDDDGPSVRRRGRLSSGSARVPRGRQISFDGDEAEAVDADEQSALPGEDDPNDRSGIELPEYAQADEEVDRRTETHDTFEDELQALNQLYSGEAETEVERPKLNTVELQAIRDSRPPAPSDAHRAASTGAAPAVRTSGSYDTSRRAKGGGRAAHWILMSVVLLLLAAMAGAGAWMYIQRSGNGWVWEQADRYYEFGERFEGQAGHRACVRVLRGDYLCRYDAGWFTARYPSVEPYVADQLAEECWGTVTNDGQDARESVQCETTVERAGGSRSIEAQYERHRHCQRSLLVLERNEATQCTTTIRRELLADRSPIDTWDPVRFESTYEFERPRENLSTAGGYFNAREYSVNHGDASTVVAYFAETLGLFVREGRAGSPPTLELIHQNEPALVEGTPVIDRFQRE